MKRPLHSWNPQHIIPIEKFSETFAVYHKSKSRKSKLLEWQAVQPIVSGTGLPFKDEANLAINLAGTCSQLENPAWKVIDALERQRNKLHGTRISSLYRWDYQLAAIAQLIFDFFSGIYRKSFGWITVIFSRLSKKDRGIQDPQVSHQTQRVEIKNVRRPKHPMQQGIQLTPSFRYPLFSFVWHNHEFGSEMVCSRHTIKLSHRNYLETPQNYREYRYCLATANKYDRQCIENGGIPVFDRDSSGVMYQNPIVRSMLVSLNRVELGNNRANSVVLELHPETLNTLSIRGYCEPITRYVTIATDFDRFCLSQAVDSFFYS